MTSPESRDNRDRITLWERELSPERVEELKPSAGKLARIARILKWIATLVPLALFATVAADGVSIGDVGVCLFVAAVLWVFVGIVSFAGGAMSEHAGSFRYRVGRK
jgi:hypothetical protein